jgi:hypothetical protein
MGCSWFNIETNKKKKHQLTIKTCIKYVDKKSPVMRPNLQPKISIDTSRDAASGMSVS